MATVIDFNCDLGESFGSWKLGLDEEVVKHVTSVNVATGFHAGDPDVMASTVKISEKLGVGIGAQPGYPDLVGFGRRDIDMTPDEIANAVTYQMGALTAFTSDKKLQHLKKRSFNNYKISIHPLNEKSKEHLHLKKMIKINLIKNKNKPNNIPIILGAPGGTASEMLDTVGKVYHICDNYLDIFSQKIWKNVKVTKISDSIYEYKKISYKFLLTNGNKNNFYNLINKNKNF